MTVTAVSATKNYEELYLWYQIKSLLHIQNAKKAGLTESMVLQEKTKQIVNDFNRDYRKNYLINFTIKFKNTLIKPNVRNTAKLIKKNIEELWEETCFEI